MPLPRQPVLPAAALCVILLAEVALGAPAGLQPYALSGVVLKVGTGVLTVRLETGGTVTLRLLPGTALPAAVGGLAAGARVRVWALAVPRGMPVALRLMLLGGAVAAGVERDGGILRGVVVGRDGSMVSVLREDNVLTTVVVTGATVVSGVLASHAIVEVDGARNSDGSFSARVLRVLFDPRTATRMSGRITLYWAEVGFALSGGAVVALRDDTWILRGMVLRSSRALAPGTVVTVLGTGAPPYIAARVVDIRL
ncbi:MAG: DUF5666 domain-containing protein [Armatimonadota bacterium]|nr:DUF5666 domain-containing protein [Armatimonadota bacterium]MDR7427162.1 DUF5666 domain-containing protein [Armatimonadota bacterium]MDR7465056.1 DUF5666 domain-containing protein [Armatimonadota bacterium]MDR7470467.1 DUF5666 domain-containing protein [Armatimonadota bacterium]MDR7473555.1 DUF5666 domain-containing protein [Armatimonadota bacterium]